MSVAKVIEITSTSKKSFDDAIQDGIKRASRTRRGIQSAWIADQEAMVKGGKVVGYQVRMKLTFLLDDKGG